LPDAGVGSPVNVSAGWDTVTEAVVVKIQATITVGVAAPLGDGCDPGGFVGRAAGGTVGSTEGGA
jgi:hypothetical protein